jgi:hypothetical protein
MCLRVSYKKKYVTDPQHWFQAKQLETRALSPIQVSADVDGYNIADMCGAQVRVPPGGEKPEISAIDR